ncbi:MAG: hypothetical protein AB1556_16570 [Bacillota bacterium]
MRQFPCNPPYVFDNDCLASFLWVKRPDILTKIFLGQILTTKAVVHELTYLRKTRYNWVCLQLEEEIAKGAIKTVDLLVGTKEFLEFMDLINGKFRRKVLGYGEASVLAWVKHNGGTVASNNISDVAEYCHVEKIGLISTDDILCLACTKKVISKKEAENLWSEMRARRRKLPDYSFAEAYHRFLNNLPK